MSKIKCENCGLYHDDCKTMGEKLDLAKEFIDDCAVSHHETRYKNRAQIIKKKLESMAEKGG